MTRRIVIDEPPRRRNTSNDKRFSIFPIISFEEFHRLRVSIKVVQIGGDLRFCNLRLSADVQRILEVRAPINVQISWNWRHQRRRDWWGGRRRRRLCINNPQ